jgi:hypothetical protein
MYEAMNSSLFDALKDNGGAAAHPASAPVATFMHYFRSSDEEAQCLPVV